MTAWLQSEIESVGGWLKDGHSGLQISKLASTAFGRKVTRNAVIGVVHRRPDLKAIGFDPDNRKKVGKPKGSKSPAAARDAKPLATRPFVPASPRHPSKIKLQAIEGLDLTNPFALRSKTVKHRAPPRQLHFVAMRFADCLPNRCRAPLNYDLDEKPGPDMLCCGFRAMLAKPYCEYHEIRLTARNVEFVAEAA
jgi:GcrA cell cycle regulator